MTERLQLSELFTYESSLLGFNPPCIIFKEVELLHDLCTTKGTYTQGAQFIEADLDFPGLLLTFYSDSPYGVWTECQINMRLEQDL